jgi:hypothetical protein
MEKRASRLFFNKPGAVCLILRQGAGGVLLPIQHNTKPPAYELYDHTGGDGETTNLAAEKPDVVKELSALIDAKMK